MPPRIRLSQKTIDRYRDQLALATRKFDAEARPVIERLQNYFLGKQWPAIAGPDPTVPRVTVNLLFSDVKVMLPTLALRNPRIFVKPVGATATLNGQPAQMINGQPVPLLAAARAQEALVNWRWRQLHITQQIRRTLVDALLSPFGIMKLGYTLETEKVQGDELLEVNDRIKADTPFAVRWCPLEFRVDPEARYPDLSDAAWIAFGWKARLDDIQRDPRYSNTRDLKPTVSAKLEYRDASVGGPAAQADLRLRDQEDYRRVQLWECWQKRDHTLIVLADDHDKALRYDDWPMAFENFPAETLTFTEYPDTLYGPPDLAQITAQQDAYNEIAAMILNHVKRFLRKYVTQTGAFEPSELAKFQMAIDGLTIESNAKPQEAIIPVPDAAIPVDWWQARINVRDDHDRVSGITDFTRGLAEKVDTATEAGIISSNLNVRTNDTRNTVEEFAERVAKKLLRIEAQTVDVPTMVPVVGMDGALAMNQFVQVQSREQLLTDSDIEVEVGSMQPTNQAIRKRDVLEVYSMLRDDPMVDQFALRKRLVPAYQDSIPDMDSLFLSREQFALVAQRLQPPPPPPPQPGPLPQPVAPGQPLNASV